MALVLVFAACRPDPGTPEEEAMLATMDAGSATDGPLPGPNPYVPGTRRLSFGLFYEGASSTHLEIDDATRHYYIFGLEGSGASTYTQRSSSDRVEGLQSDELVLVGTPWWGGGIVWDSPVDLSAWTTLHVSLSSPDAGLAALSLRMLSGDGAPKEASVNAADFGWKSDGAWHHLAIPFSAFIRAGAQLTKVRGPFVIGGGKASAGESILVDDLYAE